MRTTYRIGFALTLALGLAPPVAAQTRDAGPPPVEERLGLDTVFGPSMVLQRDRPIRIWGHARPGERVRVSLGTSEARATADATGGWSVILPRLRAGGPFTLRASAPSFRDAYGNVMIGDVWLCSGQSNMGFRRSKATDLPQQFKRDDDLRLLDIARREAPAPSSRLVPLGGWAVSTPASAARFSAVCHHFGETLRAKKGVPVGLIAASWGGTRIAAFVDAATLKARGVASNTVDPVSRQNDGHVFNAMIAPLAPFGLKGVLWYQGESDTHRPDAYAQRLAALAASWRRSFAQPLPIVVVQLPPFSPPPPDRPGQWAEIREAQRRFVAGDSAAGLVVQIDQRSAGNLHPTDKAAVAERAAETALSIAYDLGAPMPGARLDQVERRGSTLVLQFETREPLTSSDGRTVRGFELCGNTCLAVPGRLTASHRVELAIPPNLAPRCLRYAWADAPDGDLRTASGWPAGPFRSSLGNGSTPDSTCR